jgi:hypothetical protein
MIGGLDDLHRGPLPGLHAIGRRDRRCDRQAYLEVEDLTGIAKVVGEPRACNRNLLRGNGHLQFGKSGPHDVANLFPRNPERNGCRELRRGLKDTKRFDHGYLPF